MRLIIFRGKLFLFGLFYTSTFIQCFHLHQSDTSEYSDNDATCGYNSCPSLKRSNPGRDILNVHIIPHSHDDTGWLKTVDQYYLGSNRARFNIDEENQRVGVQYILDSVVKELMFDSSRRYYYHF